MPHGSPPTPVWSIANPFSPLPIDLISGDWGFRASSLIVKINQLLTDLAVGGRAVYDLTTGQQVPEAIHTTDSVPGTGIGTVLIGGKSYECGGRFNYGYRGWFDGSGVPSIYPHYSVT